MNATESHRKNEHAILRGLHRLGFTPHPDYDDLFDAMNGDTGVRVAEDAADRAWRLYTFAGRPGRGPLKTEVTFSPDAPAALVLAVAEAALK